MANYQRHSKKMQAKAKKCQVEDLGEGLYKVTSTSGSEYLVHPETHTCACDWHKYHPHTACSHLIAVEMYREEMASGRRASFWNEEADAKRQHRPMSQMADIWKTSRATA